MEWDLMKLIDILSRSDFIGLTVILFSITAVAVLSRHVMRMMIDAFAPRDEWPTKPPTASVDTKKKKSRPREGVVEVHNGEYVIWVVEDECEDDYEARSGID